MENWKTADELREIAIGETSESVNKFMTKAMDEMLCCARKGERYACIHCSSGTPSPVRDKVIEILRKLGYSVDIYPTGLRVAW